ncbi:MAG TPA: energy transducer TonB [Methylotenera sp.]|nr:energy transducer TonB [Methylotenera sp.]
MNAVVTLKLAISIGLSLIAHVLIIGLLILIFPETIFKTKSLAKNNILTIDFLKSGVDYKYDSIPNSRDDIKQSIHEVESKKSIAETNVVDQSTALIPQPKYYTLAELDQKPTIVKNIDTNPLELRQYSKGGYVKVRLWIDEQGNVVNAELVDSDLPEQFSKYSLQSFLSAKFTPGIKSDLPVRSVAKIVVKFSAIDYASQ